jgi:RNA polymerase sigma-70 factor (ECF subfamily)
MMLAVSQQSGASVDLTAAFYSLYDREAQVVLRYLRSAVRDQGAAEDICADAFCRAWDAWPRFHGSDAEARAWVFKIARNLVIDRVRRDGRLKFETLGGDEPAGDDPTAASAGTLDLRRAMARLDRDDRDLLAMRVAGLSHREIGAASGRSEEAVKKAWQRALRQLRAELEADA